MLFMLQTLLYCYQKSSRISRNKIHNYFSCKSTHTHSKKTTTNHKYVKNKDLNELIYDSGSWEGVSISNHKKNIVTKFKFSSEKPRVLSLTFTTII